MKTTSPRRCDFLSRVALLALLFVPVAALADYEVVDSRDGVELRSEGGQTWVVNTNSHPVMVTLGRQLNGTKTVERMLPIEINPGKRGPGNYTPAHRVLHVEKLRFR